ncbi:hypothetical protein AFK68_15130, partial [Hydrocoleum sp. CS-953]|uniref:Ig-like domain-containing protein n=1 Tax=Hydrocoleum sp. CS-953 TaxID=1671698 RepID=UPI000BC76CE5
MGKEGNNTLLYEIDVTDGSIISSVEVSGSDIKNSTQVEGLTSDSNGVLWAIDNKTGTLFTLDPDTGDATTEVTANVSGTDLGNAGQTGDGLESLAIEVDRNDIPDAMDDTATVDEDTPTNIAVLGNDDFGGDGPNEGTITVGDVTNGTATVNDGGTPNDPTDDTIDFTPDENYSGPATINYTITDSDGETDTATVTVTVDPVNDPPVAEDDSET